MHCTEKRGRVLLDVKARGQNKSKRKSMKSKLGEAWQDRRRRQQGQNQSITPSELARPNWLLLTQVQQWWCLFKIWCFALAMFKSWSKNRHNKHFSLQTHMNGFQQRCLTRKFGNRTLLKAYLKAWTIITSILTEWQWLKILAKWILKSKQAHSAPGAVFGWLWVAAKLAKSSTTECSNTISNKLYYNASSVVTVALRACLTSFGYSGLVTHTALQWLDSAAATNYTPTSSRSLRNVLRLPSKVAPATLTEWKSRHKLV